MSSNSHDGFASIVVLSYNGLEETTKPCLESIVKNTPEDSYELIVVDNASVDGTQEYLREFAEGRSNVKLCLNDTNKGYAGGNNDGMKLAQGEYLILLNNDTLVPPDWLNGLLRLFEQHKDIGLIGPVTNSAGNEQRVDLEGLNEGNFELIAGSYTHRQRNIWFETAKLGFFCVAMPRTVMLKVGYFDEQFGIGMFEDDDYCVRVKKAGYRLIVVEDCFVFHKGSVSFGKLSSQQYHEIFAKNRAYFRAKHQLEWTLTDLALSYWNKIDNDIAMFRKTDLNVSNDIERVSVRLESFRLLLLQLMQIEITKIAEPGSKIKLTPQAKKALWDARFNKVKSEFIYGDNATRLRFAKKVLNRLFDKIRWASVASNEKVHIDSLASNVFDIHQVIISLYGIREESKCWKKAIVLPATVDFVYMHQRPQNLAEAFARLGYLVVYGTLNFWGDEVDVVKKIEDNLYVVNEAYFSLLSHVFKPSEVIYYCMWPNNVKHLDYLPYSLVIYDYMDEISLLNLPSDELTRDHNEMMKRADFITVTARSLLEKIPNEYKGKSILLPNAVSDEFIQRANNRYLRPSEIESCGFDRVIGYYGALAEWVDFELLGEIAHKLSDKLLLLIGPVDDSVKQKVLNLERQYKNVCVLPPKKQLELIPYLQYFDVCLIPFKKNEITDSVSPVKLFEYFSAGKPVVSTNIDECCYVPLVKIANNYVEFIGHLESILAGIDSLDYQAYIDYSQMNTWRYRVEAIESTCLVTDSQLE